MSKEYNVGMYGGKFFPMHKGHLWCIEQAAKECEKLYVIMFINGEQELNIGSDEEYLSKEERARQLGRATANFDNAIPVVIDVSECKNEDGSENWDMETPLVNEICGHLDAVYGSEPSYADYYAKAYPDAVYRMFDPNRSSVNISATKIRNMSPEKRGEWMV